MSEFAKFVYGSIGKPPNKIHKQLDSFYIAYGGTILPAKIAKVLYDESLVYLDRKKELANHIIGEYL